MRLVIAEKPSMAREIAAALGVARRGNGYLEGQQYIVTWCVGHLVELDQAEAYDERFKEWRLEHLPIIPEHFKYRVNSQTKDQFKVIKDLLERKDIDEVINAADAGREGELIFDLVYRVAKSKKPVKRLWISSLTKDDIQKGFKSLKPAEDYKGLRDSAHARQRSDWLVGINGTRIFTIKARDNGVKELFSLGRVQTPTLALIVERDQEIANFVPTTYYQVMAEFQTEKGNYQGIWFKGEINRFDKLEDAKAVVSWVLGKTGVVEKVDQKPIRERSPLLFDLTTLQRVANTRFGLSAAQTLEIAQSLYEKKLITYPRTSSQHLSSGVAAEIKEHLEAANFGPYANFVRQIVDNSWKLSNRHVDDKKVTDHHAIICTKEKIDPAALNDNEKRIYDLVVRRFLAAFFPDAELERTTIITLVSGERFITKGTEIIKPGWRIVDPPAKEDKKRDDNDESDNLPSVKQKQPVTTVKAEALTKQTKAPSRYTEASLLGAMESAGKQIEDEELRLAMKDGGLGTPATRAAIIETLLKREYIERDKKSLIATSKGIALINLLPSKLLKSAELTGMWEKKLADMANDRYSFQTFMDEVKEMVTALTKEISSAQLKMELEGKAAAKDSKEAIACPKCLLAKRDGLLIEIKSEKGRYIVCSLGREVCGYIGDLPKNGKQRKAIEQTRCPNCKGAMRLRLPKEGNQKAVLLCLDYASCKGVAYFDDKGVVAEAKPKTNIEHGPACSLCGSPTIKRGPFKSKNGNGESYFWGCSKWSPNNQGCQASPVWIISQ